MKDGPIGIFDSGVGGLSILEACRRELPCERFEYVFDRRFAPYGDKSDEYIKRRALAVASLLTEDKCKALVVACNTATAVALDDLKKKCKVPVIGVFPPVKQAVRASGAGKALIMVTQATSRQPGFLRLINECCKEKIILAPQKLMAVKVEENFSCTEKLRGYVYSVLDKYENVQSVAIGCTHYAFIKNLIDDYYGKKVRIFDPASGVAKRLSRLIASPCGRVCPESGSVRFVFT